MVGRGPPRLRVSALVQNRLVVSGLLDNCLQAQEIAAIHLRSRVTGRIACRHLPSLLRTQPPSQWIVSFQGFRYVLQGPRDVFRYTIRVASAFFRRRAIAEAFLQHNRVEISALLSSSSQPPAPNPLLRTGPAFTTSRQPLAVATFAWQCS